MVRETRRVTVIPTPQLYQIHDSTSKDTPIVLGSFLAPMGGWFYQTALRAGFAKWEVMVVAGGSFAYYRNSCIKSWEPCRLRWHASGRPGIDAQWWPSRTRHDTAGQRKREWCGISRFNLERMQKPHWRAGGWQVHVPATSASYFRLISETHCKSLAAGLAGTLSCG
jgi:hypothetical protein